MIETMNRTPIVIPMIVGRPDSNLQDQGTPSLVVVTHFEVRVGVEEPRARAVDDYIYSDLGSRIGFGYSNSELSI